MNKWLNCNVTDDNILIVNRAERCFSSHVEIGSFIVYHQDESFSMTDNFNNR